MRTVLIVCLAILALVCIGCDAGAPSNETSAPTASSLSGTLQVTDFVVAEGETVTVDGDLTIIASGSVDILGTLRLTPGVNLSIQAARIVVAGKVERLAAGAQLTRSARPARRLAHVDPTFTSSGNIVLTGSMTFPGESIAIVAAGSIQVAGAASIDTRTVTGGDITIVAGASFTSSNPSGVENSTIGLYGGPVSVQAADITINGGVTLTSNDSLTLTTDGGALTNGGTISMIAFAGVLSIMTPSLVMGDGAGLHVANDSTVSIASPSDTPLTVTGPPGSAAGVSTAGGRIDIEPGSGMVTFVAPFAQTWLNLNGIVFVAAAQSVVVDQDVTLALAASLTIDTPSLTNNGAVQSNGDINVRGEGGLTVSGSGSLQGDALHFQGQGGAVAVSQDSVTGTVTGAASNGGFSVTTTSGALAFGNLSTTGGSMSLVGTQGLAVSPGATIAVAGGDLLVQSTNPTEGSILFGQGATVNAVSSNQAGQVFVIIGPTPLSTPPGTPPANTNVNLQNGGNVFFGLNGITALAPTNFITAVGAVIVFDVQNAPSTAITLGGGVSFTVN